MQDDNSKGAFARLVAGLSEEDRTAMLESLSKNNTSTVQLTESDLASTDGQLSLEFKLKDESFFYKVYLWIRSFLTKQSKEKLYNDDLVALIAKKISHEHPGLINHKQYILDSIFFERIKTIREAAEFFKPYFALINDNPGDFYVFLSSFVAPEIADEVNLNADPFKLPFEQEPTNETKNELLRALDEQLKNMKTQTKANLYDAVASINWLKQFSKLPFIHFTSQFTNISGNSFTCPYRNAINDYDAFAAVFSNVRTVSPRALEALFLFSQRKELKSPNVQQKDIENAVQAFLGKTNSYLSAIQMFLTSVPINRLGKVINGDYDWQAGNIPGVEAWFPSFRAQWRKIIEVRWNDWLRERKKNMLGEALMNDFGLEEFPVMDYRPWRGLWGNTSFACELTGGFLNWYLDEKFDDSLTTLNEVMMEGIFYRNENRTEYSDGLNLYASACNQMGQLVARLSPSGEYGQTFEDFISNKVRSLQVQNQIDSMMSSTENEVRDILRNFAKGCRMMENVFKGFFDDEKDGTHEGLSNFTTIKGRQNREWRDKLAEVRDELKKSLFYISELEPIDASVEQSNI